MFLLKSKVTLGFIISFLSFEMVLISPLWYVEVSFFFWPAKQGLPHQLKVAQQFLLFWDCFDKRRDIFSVHMQGTHTIGTFYFQKTSQIRKIEIVIHPQRTAII
jgi:hypothetical protein